MTTDKTKRIADALRAYYRSEHSAPITLMHAADLIEQLQRDLDDAQAGESIAQIAALRAQEPVVRTTWSVDDSGATIQDDDFTHDVVLRVDGDFESRSFRLAYAQKIVAALNSATQPADAHEQTAAAMAADNCEMWRNECTALRAALQDVATVAHEGGLSGLDESAALIAVRRITLPFWARRKGGAA